MYSYLRDEQDTLSWTIAIVSAVVWIYWRDSACYTLLPRRNIPAAIGVGMWVWLFSITPLALPVGLLVLYVYSLRFRKQTPGTTPTAIELQTY